MSSHTNSRVIRYPLKEKDAAIVAAIRAQSAESKGAWSIPEGREPYDAIWNNVAAADGVHYEQAAVGGINGVWCRPENALAGAAILYLHGGGYVMGSAQAYRQFAGQFAKRVKAAVFVADYRLAPENPFPAALEDAQQAYLGLVSEGAERIVVIGDSAGGGLSLSLLSALQNDTDSNAVRPVAAVVMSPWTDLEITGESVTGKADEELYLSQDMLKGCASMYLGNTPASHPQATVLNAALSGLPPLQIHVGTSEILLDDALRYAQRAQDAGVDATLYIWDGMPHVFPNCTGIIEAADQALEIMTSFITPYLTAG